MSDSTPLTDLETRIVCRRDVILPDGTTHAGRTPAHWRRVALIAPARRSHASVGLTSPGRAATSDL